MTKEWTLISEWFWPKNEIRRAELTRTLSENLDCSQIEEVVLYAETIEGLEKFLGNEKLTIIQSKKRPTYSRLVKEANNRGALRLVVIANNDISFRYFKNFLPQTDTVYCSTRHELVNDEIIWFDDIIDHRVPGGKHKSHVWSQDAWFFQTPLKLKGGNYVMGTPGCDNKIAWHFFKSGYKVLNNGCDIKLIHHHRKLGRDYNKKKLPSPYLYPSISGSNRIVFFPKKPPYGKRVGFQDWHILKSLFLSPWDFLFTIHLLTDKMILRREFNYKIKCHEDHP